MALGLERLILRHHAQHFVERRQTLRGFFDAVLEQRAHAVPASRPF